MVSRERIVLLKATLRMFYARESYRVTFGAPKSRVYKCDY
jgi:hypothetical protein